MRNLPVDDIVRRYQCGASLTALANLYGVAPATIAARLRAAGVRLRHSTVLADSRTPAQWRTLGRRWSGGVTLTTLAREVGVTPNTLAPILRKYGGRPPLTAAEYASARAMLDAGASVAAISLALGLDGQVTRSLLEGPAHTPVVDPTEASRLWREGMRVTDIALAYGVHPLTVSRALTRAGVRRPCGNRRAPLPEREIAERRAAGESISALARAYGVSRPTIRLRLRGGRTGLDLDAIDLHDPELIGWRGGGPEVWE